MLLEMFWYQRVTFTSENRRRVPAIGRIPSMGECSNLLCRASPVPTPADGVKMRRVRVAFRLWFTLLPRGIADFLVRNYCNPPLDLVGLTGIEVQVPKKSPPLVCENVLRNRLGQIHKAGGTSGYPERTEKNSSKECHTNQLSVAQGVSPSKPSFH